MNLLARIRHRRVLSVVVVPPGDPQCCAVAVSTGKRCKLPADATGYCGTFHKAAPGDGPRLA